MRKFLKQFRYGEKGFTLIELLIVIAILGVLAAVVIPNVRRFTQSGQKAAALQEMQTVQTAVDAAMAEAGVISITGDNTIGPLEDPTDQADSNNLEIGDTGIYVGDFLRRSIEGQWTVGTEGLITSGYFKTTAEWNYDGTSWTWGEPSG